MSLYFTYGSFIIRAQVLYLLGRPQKIKLTQVKSNLIKLVFVFKESRKTRVPGENEIEIIFPEIHFNVQHDFVDIQNPQVRKLRIFKFCKHSFSQLVWNTDYAEVFICL